MASEMFKETATPAETHATLLALEGRLTSMDSLMLVEM
jgi:hypothetical protein